MDKIRRSFQIEWMKLKASHLLSVHIIIPIIGVLGYCSFLGVYRPQMNIILRLLYYSQLLCIAFPFIIGLVTSIAVKQEEETRCFYILGTIHSSSYQIMIKCFYLILISGFSIAIAIGGMVLGDYMIYGDELPSIGSYSGLILILLLSNSILYFWHVFLALRFNTAVTLTVSIFGSLLAGILETGLGEGIWSYVPYAWGLRLSGYFLLDHMQSGSHSLKELIKGQDVLVIFSLYCLIGLLIWTWSRKWEGNKAFE